MTERHFPGIARVEGLAGMESSGVAVKMMDVFEAMCSLFGERYESDPVQRFLAGMPAHKLDKPTDGAQYAISSAGGFDLLFKDKLNRGPGKKQDRSLCAVFLYNRGADDHERFEPALPFGFTFDDARPDLIRKRPPDLTWDLDAGQVPVDFTTPSFDEWQLERLELGAHYYATGGNRTTAK